MNNKIKLLKENLNKAVWYEENYNIAPYLIEERGKFIGKCSMVRTLEPYPRIERDYGVFHQCSNLWGDGTG